MKQFKPYEIINQLIATLQFKYRSIFLSQILMIKELQDLLKNPNDIIHHQATLKTKPKTPQEKFYHIIGHITLLKQKIVAAEFEELYKKYKGSLSCKILSYKHMSYCMENKLVDKYYHFKILSVLSSWIDRLEKLKNQDKLRLMNTVAYDLANRGMEGIEDTIVYLNYIGIDLISILQKQQQQEIKKQETQNQINQKKQQQYTWKKHLDVADILAFTSGILPKVLHNIILSNDFFPHSFLPTEAPTIDLLYRNQSVQMLARSRPHYQKLLKVLIKLLLVSQTDQIQTRQLVLLTFRYYYIFHFDKSLGANQLVIQGLRKMIPSVRFALCDEILLFLVIIRKLGKDLFINYLANKFDWMPLLIKKIDDNPMIGIAKDLVKPFPSSQLKLFAKHNLARGQIQTRYFEVNHKFSLFFYRVKALADDISIRMYYLGTFDSPTQKKQILLSKFKTGDEFKGCIQVIEPGIYCFQFDNTYSWIKAKNIVVQWSIFVPLQIVEQKKRPFLQVLFGNIEQNTVPQDKILKVIDQETVNEHQFWRHQSNFVRVTWNKTDKLFNITMILPNYTYQFESQSKRVMKRKFEKLGKMNENNQYLQWWIDKKKFKTWEEAIKEMQLIQNQMNYHELDQEKYEEQESYHHSSEKNEQGKSEQEQQHQQHSSELDKYHQLNQKSQAQPKNESKSQAQPKNKSKQQAQPKNESKQQAQPSEQNIPKQNIVNQSQNKPTETNDQQGSKNTTQQKQTQENVTKVQQQTEQKNSQQKDTQKKDATQELKQQKFKQQQSQQIKQQKQ